MFSNNPGEIHWRQAQVILKYLKRHVERDNEKGIVPLGLKFHHDENLNLEGYVAGQIHPRAQAVRGQTNLSVCI